MIVVFTIFSPPSPPQRVDAKYALGIALALQITEIQTIVT